MLGFLYSISPVAGDIIDFYNKQCEEEADDDNDETEEQDLAPAITLSPLRRLSMS